MTVRGVVSATSEKPFGDKVLHSFQLQGDRNYYGTGERRAPVEVGKAYEFEVKTSPSGRLSVDLSTLRPWDAGETQQAVPAQNYRSFGKTPFKGGKSEEEKAFWANREAREVKNDRLRELGATRNTALTLIGLMLQNGAVKLPAKESAREQTIYDMLNHYTDLLMKGPVAEAPTEEPKPTDPESDNWG